MYVWKKRSRCARRNVKSCYSTITKWVFNIWARAERKKSSRKKFICSSLPFSAYNEQESKLILHAVRVVLMVRMHRFMSILISYEEKWEKVFLLLLLMSIVCGDKSLLQRGVEWLLQLCVLPSLSHQMICLWCRWGRYRVNMNGVVGLLTIIYTFYLCVYDIRNFCCFLIKFF